MERPIGVFDSGVGGLTVLDSLKTQLPNERFIYIGDNAHCPYGDKTKDQLLSYTQDICHYFLSQNVKMIVMACNTTSANVLNELRVLFPEVPIIGVIDATVRDYIKRDIKSVLVIATHATIRSHKYEDVIHQYNPSLQVYELATPKLVPLIESGDFKKGIEDTLSEYLDAYQEKVDALILGCTHYPMILDQIQNVFQNKTYISSSDAICQEVATYLKEHHLFNTSSQIIKNQIYTTGDVQEFRYSSEDFFDYQNLKVESLKL